MRRFRNLIFSLLLLLVFIEIWVSFPLHLDKPESEPLPFKQLSERGVEKRMEGVHLVESRSGDRDWELYAESAEGFAGMGAWELKNVKVLFYNSDKVQFTVLGDSGRINTKTKDMDIEGHVITQSSNGYRFQTEKVHYMAAKREITSPTRVKMIGPPDDRGKGLILEGDHLLAFVDKNLMQVHDHVQSTKILSNGKKFLVRSELAEFSGVSTSARFKGAVSVELNSMKMEAPEADFQYKGTSNTLESVNMLGGVKVTDIGKYATSETLKFEPEDNRIVLSGRPRVVQDNDEILGDQIVFIDGGKRVKVEKIRARMEKEP